MFLKKFKVIILLIFTSLFNIPILKAQPVNYYTTLRGAGDIMQLAIPISALAGTVILDDRVGTKEFVAYYGLTFITYKLLNNLVGELRPDGTDRASFPSGHSMSAFTGSFFIWRRYGYKLGLPATALAAFVGYSRIKSHKHHIHDVLTSAAIAGIYSYFLVNKYTKVTTHINVSYNSQNQGIGLAYCTKF